LSSADAVFAPSTFTARRVEAVVGLSAGSVRVIPHCVPPEVDTKLENDGIRSEEGRLPTVLTAARLTQINRYKGIDTLLYAWPLIRSRIDARLVVVGDGPDRSRLERIAQSLDLHDSVTFAGRVHDEILRRRYREASLFAMPARHRIEPVPEGEGFGLVFIEAGAAGLPVVAGRGAGTEDAVEDEGSGLLVDADDHRAVAAAIIRVLGNERLAGRLGARGRELAETRFSYNVFTKAVDELVRDLGPKDLF
jgi:phosphatidylinositol alpha-1,6-mannosyltransferase